MSETDVEVDLDSDIYEMVLTKSKEANMTPEEYVSFILKEYIKEMENKDAT